MRHYTTSLGIGFALISLVTFFFDAEHLTAAEVENPQIVSLVQSDTPVSLTLSPTSGINLRNDYSSQLHDLKIFETATQKRLVMIKVLPAGESVSLSFSKTGNYSVCYFVSSEESNEADHCIELNLVKATEV